MNLQIEKLTAGIGAEKSKMPSGSSVLKLNPKFMSRPVGLAALS